MVQGSNQSEEEENPAAEDSPEDDDVITQSRDSLFVFQLRSFPSLDQYREKQKESLPYILHPLAEDRLNALLKNRSVGKVIIKADHSKLMNDQGIVWNHIIASGNDILDHCTNHLLKSF